MYFYSQCINDVKYTTKLKKLLLSLIHHIMLTNLRIIELLWKFPVLSFFLVLNVNIQIYYVVKLFLRIQ